MNKLLSLFNKFRLKEMPLRFLPEQEKAFRQYYRKNTIGQTRIALLFAVLLYGSFGLLDSWIIPEIKQVAWMLRYWLICPIYVLFWIMTFFTKKDLYLQGIAGLAIILGGAGIIFMVLIDSGLGRHLYYAGLMLVIFYAYAFIKLRFIYAMACGWGLALVYIAMAALTGNINMPIIINNTFFLVATNIIGMPVAYLLEAYIRKEYLQSIKMKKVNRQLHRFSIFDSLTKVANRRLFDSRILEEFKRARRGKYPLSLAMMDIDYFKAYNDYFGHQLGDECLVKVAAIAKKFASRGGDLIARYGGEEFMIILSDTPAEGAKVVAERIRQAVEREGISHPASAINEVVTVSLGLLTIVPVKGSSVAALIYSVDKALYKAKETGRNRICEAD